jgi:hypothetical protein
MHSKSSITRLSVLSSKKGLSQIGSAPRCFAPRKAQNAVISPKIKRRVFYKNSNQQE